MKIFYTYILILQVLNLTSQTFIKRDFTVNNIANDSELMVNFHMIRKADNEIIISKYENNTLFTVFSSSLKEEELIWQLNQSGQKMPSILTNKRYSNLSNFKFLNYNYDYKEDYDNNKLTSEDVKNLCKTVSKAIEKMSDTQGNNNNNNTFLARQIFEKDILYFDGIPEE